MLLYAQGGSALLAWTTSAAKLYLWAQHGVWLLCCPTAAQLQHGVAPLLPRRSPAAATLHVLCCSCGVAQGTWRGLTSAAASFGQLSIAAKLDIRQQAAGVCGTSRSSTCLVRYAGSLQNYATTIVLSAAAAIAAAAAAAAHATSRLLGRCGLRGMQTLAAAPIGSCCSCSLATAQGLWRSTLTGESVCEAEAPVASGSWVWICLKHGCMCAHGKGLLVTSLVQQPDNNMASMHMPGPEIGLYATSARTLESGLLLSYDLPALRHHSHVRHSMYDDGSLSLAVD